MSTVDFGTMDADASLKQTVEELANVMDKLNFLLNGNIDFKNVRVGSLTADRIKALSITAAQIAAGAITADKITVSELSAISADLGKVIAGILIGAYISTADGTYPRIDFSSDDLLMVAYLDADHYVAFEPDVGGAPGLGYYGPSGLLGRIYGNSGMGMIAIVDNIELTSLSGKIDLNAPNGISLNSIDSLAGTKTYWVSNTSGGAVTRKLTFTNGLLTSET